MAERIDEYEGEYYGRCLIRLSENINLSVTVFEKTNTEQLAESICNLYDFDSRFRVDLRRQLEKIKKNNKSQNNPKVQSLSIMATIDTASDTNYFPLQEHPNKVLPPVNEEQEYLKETNSPIEETKSEEDRKEESSFTVFQPDSQLPTPQYLQTDTKDLEETKEPNQINSEGYHGVKSNQKKIRPPKQPSPSKEQQRSFQDTIGNYFIAKNADPKMNIYDTSSDTSTKQFIKDQHKNAKEQKKKEYKFIVSNKSSFRRDFKNTAEHFPYVQKQLNEENNKIADKKKRKNVKSSRT